MRRYRRPGNSLALTRSTSASPSAKLAGGATGDQQQGLAQLFNLLHCVSQGKHLGRDQQIRISGHWMPVYTLAVDRDFWFESGQGERHALRRKTAPYKGTNDMILIGNTQRTMQLAHRRKIVPVFRGFSRSQTHME